MDNALKPGYQVNKLTYISSASHRFIGTGTRNLLENIGSNGYNLTIAVLMMNRSSLTIRLMDSIKKELPDFQGEFLIGDNGSTESELNTIKRYFKEMPFKCRCIEFGANYGVAGGRNRLCREVRTDWIFLLDNDIYFIQNPLKKIQEDIATLGCHFMCIPLLNEKNHEAFLYGGHLYVESQEGSEIGIGGGSAFIADSVDDLREHDPFLCTFVAGGSSVINKDSFFRYGGYDEGMFVGFEDTEFSIRLFQAGVKIGCCGMACVIHDHPKPAARDDKEYEKQRFSVNKLEQAALYFEKKHGFKVWNPATKDWVNKRLNELLNETITDNEAESRAAQKPKVLLVIDKPGWALDNIARQIIKNCSDVFEFKLLYTSDIDNVHAAFLAGEDCDIIHFLWRSWLADCNTAYSRGYAPSWGDDADEFYKKYIAGKKVCTSVYDHLFLEDNFEYSQRLFSDENSPLKSYSVSSEILKEIYDKDERILMKPACIITDGVDLQLFKPRNLARFEKRNADDCLIVGWAGNSMWAAEKEDFKGLHTLLKPAIEELKREGYNIDLKLCDSNENMVPHEKMPEYYNEIDLYVCMSKIEGTPNPILECMACGVPFISTNVGIVPEVAGKLQSRFILKERSVHCLKEALVKIITSPETLRQLSEENQQAIKTWDWSIRAREFIPLWEQLLKN